MKRRIIALILAICTIFSLGGCKKKKALEKEMLSQSTEEQTTQSTENDNGDTKEANKDKNKKDSAKASNVTKNSAGVIYQLNDEYDEIVSNAIFSNTKEKFSKNEGECEAEGHLIVGIEEEKSKKIIYLISKYCKYGFEDGNFVIVAGSGYVPTKIVLDKNNNIKEYLIATTGKEYETDVKEKFPKKYQDRFLRVAEDDRNPINEQVKKYATDYLKSIGRNAKVGEFSDFEHKILMNYGVSVDASNIVSYGQMANPKYPYWIGNREYLENGKRYVYEMKWNGNESGKGQAILQKYEFDTKKVVEQFIYEIEGDNAELKQ